MNKQELVQFGEKKIDMGVIYNIQRVSQEFLYFQLRMNIYFKSKGSVK